MSNQIPDHFQEAARILQEFSSKKENLARVHQAGDLMASALRIGGTIFSCGNGGSFCDAMHFAEELSGRYRNDRNALRAMAISDPSHITCVGNDYGFEKIYARFLEAHGKKGDVLLAISTSGNSKNIVEAAIQAKSLHMQVIGLTGKDGGLLSSLCDIEIRAPFSEFADRAQEIHIKVIHALIDHIERTLLRK